MSINLAKSYAIARDLSQQLEIRVAGSAAGRVNSVRNTKDVLGNPMIFLSRGGNEAAGQPVIALRILPVLNPTLSIFGQEIGSGDPSTIQVAYELDGAGQEPVALDIITVLYQSVPVGTRMNILQIADATAVTTANMDLAAIAQAFEALYWPGSGNV